MISWWNDKSMKWLVGEIKSQWNTIQWNDLLTKWQVDELKQRVDKMTSQWNDKKEKWWEGKND